MTATSLPWNDDAQAIPFDKPVLVRERDKTVPFMAVRNKEFVPDSVNCLLGPDESGYGFLTELTDIDAWLDVQ